MREHLAKIVHELMERVLEEESSQWYVVWFKRPVIAAKEVGSGKNVVLFSGMGRRVNGYVSSCRSVDAGGSSSRGKRRSSQGMSIKH